jgi:hypothetical protein
MVTTCFGRAWPSSGHNVDVHKWEKKHDFMSGWFAAAVWVGEVRCGWGSTPLVASTPHRILHIRSPQKPSPLEPHPHRTSTQTATANQPDKQSCFFSFVHINIVTWRWPSAAETCSHHRRNKYNTKTVVFFDGTLLPPFNIRKHNRDDEPEDFQILVFCCDHVTEGWYFEHPELSSLHISSPVVRPEHRKT